MGWDTDLAAMGAVLMATFKSDTLVTVTKPGAAALTNVEVILDPVQTGSDYDGQGQQNVSRRQASFLLSAVTDIPLKTLVTIGSDTWRVERVVEQDASMITVEMVMTENKEIHEQGRVLRTK